jgi:uncharacterized protein (TIGR00645 family)
MSSGMCSPQRGGGWAGNRAEGQLELGPPAAEGQTPAETIPPPAARSPCKTVILRHEMRCLFMTENSSDPVSSRIENPRLGLLPTLIFSSRWLQLPLYLGLIVAQGVYVIHFMKELIHLIEKAKTITEQEIMLIVLGLIDVVMISNLLMMVIVGGYETFVSRLRLHNHPDQPEWLSHVNASVLKVKLAMAIIGISSVHLLKTFIAAGSIGQPAAAGSAAAVPGVTVTSEGVMWQTIIHAIFILSAIGIAWTDRLMLASAGGKNGKH